MFTKGIVTEEHLCYLIGPHNYGHTATFFDQYKVFICGGYASSGITTNPRRPLSPWGFAKVSKDIIN